MNKMNKIQAFKFNRDQIVKNKVDMYKMQQ